MRTVMQAMMPTRRVTLVLTLLGVLVFATSAPWGVGRKFYDDDPLPREPETQDASSAKEQELDLVYDLVTNLFMHPGDAVANTRARNINTIDEVPDSSWFTNRILSRTVSNEEAMRGPLTGSGPLPGAWTVTQPKRGGQAPGFVMQDTAGTTWFVSFDARGYPDAATGAIMVANKIFWTLGYWQVENHLIAVHPDQLTIAEFAMIRPLSGELRRMTGSDLDELLRRANRSADGSYRAVAARAVPGRTLGPFLYHGSRPDDPNDVVPHEHRRELRALKVFGAWTNLVDMQAANTLDTLVSEGGRSTIRHYLQDVGSTFGTGAGAPHEPDEGWETLFDGHKTRQRLLFLGFPTEPWQTAHYEDRPAIGPFEGDVFDPLEWQPRVTTAALRHARADDTFWAARRVMAFSDGLIRALVKAGGYSDPKDEQHLADVLIKRRNKIGSAYLTAVNPIVEPALDATGKLTFVNAAVAAGVAPPPSGGYSTRWFTYDNATGATAAIGTPIAGRDPEARAPGALPASGFLKIEISSVQPAHASWAVPIDAYFRRTPAGWTLVGLDRLALDSAAPQPVK